MEPKIILINDCLPIHKIVKFLKCSFDLTCREGVRYKSPHLIIVTNFL